MAALTLSPTPSPAPVPARTPDSAGSGYSGTSTNSIVSRYGYDLERDCSVLNKLEDVLGRSVEPEELQQAMQGMQGQPATVKQLADAVAATNPSSCTTGQSAASSSYGDEGEGYDEGAEDEEEEFVVEETALRRYLDDGELAALLEQQQAISQSSTAGGEPESSSMDAQTTPLAPRLNLRINDSSTGEQAYGSGWGSPLAEPSSAGRPSSSRSTPTPSVPSLSLGFLRSSIRMGPLPGQFTLRTRRNCDQALDPSMLRVLLPLVARKGAASKAAKAARAAAGNGTARVNGSSRTGGVYGGGRHTSRRLPSETTAAGGGSDHTAAASNMVSSSKAHSVSDVGLTRGQSLADQMEKCVLDAPGVKSGASKEGGAVVSGDDASDVQQRGAGSAPDQHLRNSRFQAPHAAVKKVAAGTGGWLDAPAIAEEGEDVFESRDTCGKGGSFMQSSSLMPSVPCAPRAGSKRRATKANPRRKSIAPHALESSWWADYAVNEVEEEEEMLLPESMWSIHSVLQPGSSDRVSARLTERRQLAQTAYSIVYTAVLDGEKTVVVKVLDVGCEDMMANAFAEASILDSLRGWPGCVQMLTCGRTPDGQVQLVLQKADTNLRRWAEEHPERQSPAWGMHAMRMFEKAASLISQLHQQGVAHCDVKLDNLLLLNGELMLSDFSEAVAFMRPEQAVLHESRGTEAYQSPEMFKGSGADVRAADTWALGCLLLELVTGSVLFPGSGDCLRPLMAADNTTTSSATASWMSDAEVQKVQHSLREEPNSQNSFKAKSVIKLATDILVCESQRPSSAQVAVRAEGILSCWNQFN